MEDDDDEEFVDTNDQFQLQKIVPHHRHFDRHRSCKLIFSRNDIQHEDIQQNVTQHNDTKHYDIQHNVTQHNVTQHNDTAL